MLYATNIFPGDNTTRQFELTFVGGYLDKSHIVAYYEDNLSKVQTPIDPGTITWLGPYTVQLPPGAQASVGTNVVFARQTPREPLVDFQGSSRITEANLDLAHRQGLFVAVESLDSSNSEVVAQLKDVIIGVQEVADEALLSAGAAAASAAAAASSAGVSASQASQAMSSATAAQGSAGDALFYSNAAFDSRQAASGFASAAFNSQTAAGVSEANALAYRNTASGHASAALGSANAASSSAAAALASQNAAASSASSASASAAIATTQATNANTSAGNAAYEVTLATEQRTQATTQAGIATTKAGEAAASAALAASYVDPANPNWNTPSIDTLNGGSLAGFRNVIINGDMKVRQRTGQSVAVPADGFSVFTADRWQASKQGGHTVLFEHVATGNVAGRALDCVQMRATTSYAALAGNCNLIEQRVEGYETLRLRGTTFTVSFLVKATRTGTYTLAFRNAGGLRAYLATYTVSASNVWQAVTITVTGGIPSGDADGAGASQWNVTNGHGLSLSWIVNAGSTYQSASVNQWLSASVAAASTQTQGLQVSGDTFSITEVQLEVGTKRTPFERRPMSVELDLCKRYFEVVSIVGGTRGGEIGSLFMAHTPYAIQKRAGSVITPRAPILSEQTQVPTFNEVAPIGVYGILRSASTSEFYYLGLVEANSEL